jgi:hypothetical protein
MRLMERSRSAARPRAADLTDDAARAVSQHRLKGAIAASVLVTVALAGGYVWWDRVWRRAGPRNPGVSCPAVVAPSHRPPLSAIGVHRVALIGDSIMWQPSCAIAESLASVGLQTSRHGIPGSGLLNGPVEWVAETQRILQAEKPDVVIAIFVGNYWAPPVRDATGSPIAVDTPAFFRAWQARANALSAEVRATHARLYWVSPPPITMSELAHAQRLFDGYRSIPGDHVLDSGRVLAGPGGRPLVLKQSCGALRLLRSSSDAVHLSDDGARIYGEQIAHDLSAELGLLTSPRPC